MQFNFFVAPLNLTVLPRFLLPPERASFSLCGCCAEFLAEIFALRLPAWPFLGFVGVAASPVFEKDFARFTHCTAHRALLLRTGINWGESNRVNPFG